MHASSIAPLSCELGSRYSRSILPCAVPQDCVACQESLPSLNTRQQRFPMTSSACTQPKRLVRGPACEPLEPKLMDTSLSWPAPREVVFEYGSAWWLTSDHPSQILQNITHIHLGGMLFDCDVDACINLSRLTYLGITRF
jgi:hypothetical protein